MIVCVCVMCFLAVFYALSNAKNGIFLWMEIYVLYTKTLPSEWGVCVCVEREMEIEKDI